VQKHFSVSKHKDLMKRHPRKRQADIWHKKSPKALLDEARQKLFLGDFAGAESLGRRLLKMKQKSAFDILPVAYLEMNDQRKALETLTKAVHLHPEDANYWHMLAALYQELDMPEEGLKAIENAKKGEGVEREALCLTEALTRSALGQSEEALKLLNWESVPQVYLNEWVSTKLDILNTIEKFKEAFALFQEKEGDLLPPDEPFFDETLAQIYYDAAVAAASLQEANEVIEELLRESLFHERGNPAALYMLRQIRGLENPDAKVWKLTVSGAWVDPHDDSEEAAPVASVYFVRAEDLDSALDFIQEAELPAVQEMEIDESGAPTDTLPEAEEDNFVGVLRFTELNFLGE